MRFNKLNYSLGNEDFSLEAAVLPEDAAQVLAVASSGAQLIPYLAKRPAALCFVDLAAEQLAWTKLRQLTLHSLDLEDYRGFWGYSHAQPFRKLWRQDILATLPWENAQLCKQMTAVFAAHHWMAPLYYGAWERMVARMSRAYRFLLGPQVLRELFAQPDIAAQQHCVAKYKILFRLKPLLYTIALLAQTQARFAPQLLPRQHGGRFYQQYQNILANLCAHTLLRKNFFAQLLFLGELCEEHSVAEVDEQSFKVAKTALPHCKITYVQQDLATALAQAPAESLSFASLSNVPSYFSSEIYAVYLTQLARALQPGGRALSRSFLSKAPPLAAGLKDCSTVYSSAIAAELSQTYSIDIYSAARMPVKAALARA